MGVLSSLAQGGGIAGIPVCAVHCLQSVRAFSFDYDRRIQAHINYDGSSKGIFDYVGAEVHTANECAKQSASSRTLFGNFGKFLAADETGGSITLWHGTSAGNASSILANGFQTGSDGAVFFADDVSTARFYGLQTGAANAQQGAVLQFTIPQSLGDELGLSTPYEMGAFRGFRPLDIPGASGNERIMSGSSIGSFNQALQNGTITSQSFLLRSIH